jgi:hypothetical protein
MDHSSACTNLDRDCPASLQALKMMNTILRFFLTLAVGTLFFAVSVMLICGLMQLGWNLGWKGTIFDEAMAGTVLGAFSGSYWGARELFKRR